MKEVEIREKKKSHGPVILLLCLAFLLIGAGLMYYYLMVYSNQSVNTNNTNNNNLESLNTNGVLVTSLIDRLDYDNGCGISSELYKKSKTTAKTLSKDYIKSLVSKEANGKKLNGNISFTKEAFENATKTLFGTDIVLTDENITDTCTNIIFDSANQTYKGDIVACTPVCNGVNNVRYIVKAEKDSTSIYIYVAVAQINDASKKVSNLNDLDSVIEGIDSNTFNISIDYTKVNNYKYTFNYDAENNNYIFKSIGVSKIEQTDNSVTK